DDGRARDGARAAGRTRTRRRGGPCAHRGPDRAHGGAASRMTTTASTPALPERVAKQFTDDDRTFLLELRRALPRAPAPSWKETGTQSRLRDALTACGITDVRALAGTGLVARIPGSQRGGPVVAVRGDIDALPITEGTGLPFASQHAGVMHACGHDMHATWA